MDLERDLEMKITCKKCGSENIRVFGITKYGDMPNYRYQCDDCHEISEKRDPWGHYDH